MGRASVLCKTHEDVEVMVTPSHVWKYGGCLGDSDDIDDLVCLALAPRSSSMNRLEKYGEYDFNSSALGGSSILAKFELPTSSVRYGIAAVGAVDWKGASGLPVVTNTGKVIGICVMQIMSENKPEISRGLGLVVCAKDIGGSGGPILVTRDAVISRCPICKIEDVSSTDDLLEKGETSRIRSELEQFKNDGSASSTYDKKNSFNKTCEIREEVGAESADVGNRGEMVLHNSLSVVRTGVLQEACQIASLRSEKEPGYYWESGDKTSIHNIKEVLYYSKNIKLHPVSESILNAILEAMVMEEGCIFLLYENSMLLSVSSLLAAARIRFSLIRNGASFKSKMIDSRKKGGDICLLCWEDMAAWSATEQLGGLRPRYNDYKVFVYRPDDERACDACYCMSRILALFSSSVKTVVYEGVIPEKGDPNKEGERYRQYVSFDEVKTQQSEGCLVYMSVDSNAISSLDSFDHEKNPSSTKVTTCVVTNSRTAADLDRVKANIVNTTGIHKTSMSVFNSTAIIMPGTWEVLCSCRLIVIHTGLSAFCGNIKIPNVLIGRIPSVVSLDVFKDAYRLNAVVRGEMVMAKSIVAEYSYISPSTLLASNKDPIAIKVFVKHSITKIEVMDSQIIGRINSCLVNGEVLAKIDEPLRERYGSIKAEDGLSTIALRDDELISDDILLSKVANTNLTSKTLSWLKEKALKIKWRFYEERTRIEVRIVEFFRSVSCRLNSVLMGVRIKINSYCSGAKRCVAKMLLSLRKKKRENSARGTAMRMSDSDCNAGIVDDVVTCAGIACVATSISRVGDHEIKHEDRLRNGVAAALAWLLAKISVDFDPSKKRSLLERAFYYISRAGLISEAASRFLDKTWKISLGYMEATNESLSKFSLSDLVREAVSKLSCYLNIEIRDGSVGVSSSAKKKGTTAKQTAMIIADKRAGAPWYNCIFLFMEALNNGVETLYRLIFREDLARMFGVLWASIKSRGEGQKGPKGTIKAVPCIDVYDMYYGTIVLGATTAACYKIAAARSKRSSETIGVLSDKKHTADLVDLYMSDRSSYSTASRCITLASGVAAMWQGGNFAIAYGAMCVAGVVADWLTSEKSELGLAYSASNLVTRLIWSRNKASVLIGSTASLLLGKDLGSYATNTIIITSSKRIVDKRRKADRSGAWVDECYRSMANAQKKERRSNAILMNMNEDPWIAYKRAKAEILGADRSKEKDFYDKDRWDVDESSLDETIDLTMVATKGEATDEVKHVVRKLSEITSRQCRYLGRTRKIKMDLREDVNDYESVQSSVFFLDEEVWRGVIDTEDRKKWDAAGDSRFSVLMAIAERNDSAPMLEVSEENLKVCAESALGLYSRICSGGLIVLQNPGRLSWSTVIRNLNEKSTSGTLTRRRSGQTITAGYVPNFGDRVEACKEMLSDGSHSMETCVVNVFAKRRIEKKKISETTGEMCVITRTIQASESDVKLSVIEAFCCVDKVMKLTRNKSGICLGMNFFMEYSEDDIDCMLFSRSSGMELEGKKIVRVSLDHSSFDGNQRNWSMEMAKKIRERFIDDNENNCIRVKQCKRYLESCYESSRIRTLITTSGDLFACSGQQMSGYATTSSDNSMKAWVYTDYCRRRLMREEKGIEILEDTIRVQGDDSKLTAIVSASMEDWEIAKTIGDKMREIGQVVKPEKMEVNREFGKNPFLSHWVRLRPFLVSNPDGEERVEVHGVPTREYNDIFSMIATTLKASKGQETKKTKKEVSLLASKGMSYLIMYAGEPMIVYLTVSVIWACFKILSALRSTSSRMDIRTKWLPWLAASGEVNGEFEIDIGKILEKHGVERSASNTEAVAWICDGEIDSREYRGRVLKMQDNFFRVFPKLGRWDWEVVNKAFIELDIGSGEVKAISVKTVNAVLKEIKKDLSLSISENEVKYYPFTVLKIKAKNSEKDKELEKADVYLIGDDEDTMRAAKIIAKARGDKLMTYKMVDSVLTEDGIRVLGAGVTMLATRRGARIALMNSDSVARAVGASSWKCYEVVKASSYKTMKNIMLSRGYNEGELVEERATRSAIDEETMARVIRGECDEKDIEGIFWAKMMMKHSSSYQVMIGIW